jgi:hypothetical protein
MRARATLSKLLIRGEAAASGVGFESKLHLLGLDDEPRIRGSVDGILGVEVSQVTCFYPTPGVPTASFPRS